MRKIYGSVCRKGPPILDLAGLPARAKPKIAVRVLDHAEVNLGDTYRSRKRRAKPFNVRQSWVLIVLFDDEPAVITAKANFVCVLAFEVSHATGHSFDWHRLWVDYYRRIFRHLMDAACFVISWRRSSDKQSASALPPLSPPDFVNEVIGLFERTLSLAAQVAISAINLSS